MGPTPKDLRKEGLSDSFSKNLSKTGKRREHGMGKAMMDSLKWGNMGVMSLLWCLDIGISRYRL